MTKKDRVNIFLIIIARIFMFICLVIAGANIATNLIVSFAFLFCAIICMLCSHGIEKYYYRKWEEKINTTPSGQ
ncbi:MAG: hypothetical protein JSW73_00505 [Candidatus Woesearchaeota archaeon]|nr:MAG: hypothetical protein JSW73_00505 [Candidatus Woesearchaeota archaeon]